MNQFHKGAFRRKKSLFTPTELQYWQWLLQAMPQGWTIAPKVRMFDLMNADFSVRGRIMQKHVDFAIIELASGRVIAAIEVDGTTHSRPDRVDRDNMVNEVFACADIPLIRVTHDNASELSRIIQRLYASAA